MEYDYEVFDLRIKPKSFSEQKTYERRDVVAEVTINVTVTINETVYTTKVGYVGFPIKMQQLLISLSLHLSFILLLFKYIYINICIFIVMRPHLT